MRQKKNTNIITIIRVSYRQKLEVLLFVVEHTVVVYIVVQREVMIIFIIPLVRILCSKNNNYWFKLL